MNKVALLVAACCAVVGLCGFGMGLNTCDSSEESIRHCIVVIFDRNKDGVITMDELERSFKDRVTYDSNLNATMVMRGGDLNGDGVLTQDDWTHPNRTILKDAVQLDMACFWCRQNGVNMDLTFEGQKKKDDIKHV